VSDAGLGRLAPPRSAESDVTLWVGRIAAAAAAFAAGATLGHANHPVQLVLLAALGALAAAVAIARLRWLLIAALFLLVAYVLDVLVGGKSAHALTAIVLAAAVLHWVTGRERVQFPRELLAFAPLLVVYTGATLFASDRSAAAAETTDLLSYAVVVALLLTLLTTPTWLRRALWAVVAGIGMLALLAILQQVTGGSGSSYGGFARVIPSGDALRSAGPLNANTFGQLLVASAVLAFYLSRMEARLPARALAWAIAGLCLIGVAYTQSRAALIALVIAALAIGVLRGVRVRVLAVALVAAVAVGLLVLPQTLQQRVGALSDIVSSEPASVQDTALRGRTSENLAAVHMWADHPLVGVGPDNFEGNYQRYSTRIGIDPRPTERGAHNLYLESLAETGLLGAMAFLAVLGLALVGPWRARSRLPGTDALLGEALFVALGAFLICAFTLNSAYARYQWIFLGLGLVAGRLARRPAE
jgi:putative inorganic carbon (HCO3(-)) transporter